ncbi:hypothetical protein [uncultured Cellulomonas sp.]|uniref:hypothetical protein n=1 Tax=uncultured Cellulomonas sp. TaxID=189682 RepID=UPI0026087D2A|nr:hypothetical protein [uncultured Cellulomonas sp.]
MFARPVRPPAADPAAGTHGATTRRRRASARWAAGAALALAAAVTTPAVGPAAASTADAAAPADAAATQPLSFAPPELTNPTTVSVSVANRNLKLDPTRDYIIQMPDTPLVAINGLQIHGGRNVVLIGGQIELPEEAIAGTTHAGRGLYLHNQRGTVHVEGLRITGPGLEDGINLGQIYGARVQLQNIRVDTAHGSQSGAHADVLQSWAGPRQLLVDGLTGHTEYQGFFMLPTQQWADPVEPELFDLRRVDLHGTPTSGYLMWRDGLGWPLTVRDVWVAPKDPSWRDGFLWPKGTLPGSEAWPSVNIGSPAQGEFVPVGTAGVDYVSPGYRSSADVDAVPPTTSVPTSVDLAPEPAATPATAPAATPAPAPAPEPAPEPVPAPAPAPQPSSVDHTAFGYVGAWSVSTARGEHYTKVAGRTASITAQVGEGGGSVSLQGILGTNKGMAAVSVDGGPEVMVSQYRNPGTTDTFFTTPELTAGPHSLTVRVTGTRAPGGTDSYVALTGATTTNGTLAAPDPAPVVPPEVSPVGSFDSLAPVPGGLRVRGWAADRDTTGPIAVDVTVAGTTTRVTADASRPDVRAVFGDLSASAGFDTVVSLPVGSHEVCVTAVNVGSGTDTSFGCRTATVLDVTAPVFAGTPLLDLRPGAVSTSGVVPVTARWSVTDDVAVDAVRLTSPASAELGATATATDLDVPAGPSTVAVAADDAAGNTASASATRTVTLVPDTQASRASYWWTVGGSALLDGSALRTNRGGASMSHTFTGRSVAWVAMKAPDHGRAHVYVDDVLQATVDLGAPTKSHRDVVFTHGWDEVGTHTITVVVEGTRGRATVTSDGFVTVD